MPIVSIIIPAYNRAALLPETLESALGQTVTDIECMIVDDGSTDDTAAVVDRFRERDPRVRYLRQAHRGQSAARNYGLAESSGRFIQFLDSDDVIVADKLARQVEQLDESREELALSYCDYRFCVHNDVSKTAAEGRLPPHLIMEKPLWDIASRWETELSIPMHCFLFDARLFRQRGVRFDEELANHVDWDCWMRIFALEPTVIYLPEVLAIYRVHGDSICADHQQMAIGFEKAIRKQQQVFQHDPIMVDILAAKLLERTCTPADWMPGIRAATDEIRRFIPPGETMIFVDDDSWDAGDEISQRRKVPFLEERGRYWGHPPDDETAIRELERLRETGAKFLVFVWTTFWWLDHYREFAGYLRRNFACLSHDERVMVFDLAALKRDPAPDAARHV